MTFAGRVAVVTGGASGIGLATAALFAHGGASVVILDRDVDQGEAAAAQIRSQTNADACFFIPADVAVERQVIDAVAILGRSFDRVHHLVNSAGKVLVKAIEESTSDDWDAVMNVNVKSMFFTMKYLFPFLKAASPASIVNVGSVSSFVGQKLTPIYVASKGAVAMLSKSVALDFAQHGIRVNCVCPGITDTPMFQQHARVSLDPEQTIKERKNRVPLNRLLSGSDIANTILFLCSDQSAGITGTNLLVDGGYLAAAEWTNS